jgi:hypothetical protein
MVSPAAQPAEGPGGGGSAPPAGKSTNPLLASMSEQTRLNLIGERLFPLISQLQPEKAGKITGLLLVGNSVEKLLHLLDDPTDLQASVSQALDVIATSQLPPDFVPSTAGGLPPPPPPSSSDHATTLSLSDIDALLRPEFRELNSRITLLIARIDALSPVASRAVPANGPHPAGGVPPAPPFSYAGVTAGGRGLVPAGRHSVATALGGPPEARGDTWDMSQFAASIQRVFRELDLILPQPPTNLAPTARAAAVALLTGSFAGLLAAVSG